MADLKWYTVSRVIKCLKESDRDVDGYRNDPEDTRVRRAILNKAKSADNKTYIRHECLMGIDDDKSLSKKIKSYYKMRYGKTMRKDGTLASVILPFPRDYLPADYKLTNEEYSVLCRELDGKLQDADSEVLESAHKKMLSRDFSDVEKMQIYDFFAKYIDVCCKVFGIKKDDILYATLHMDESNPHMHLCFFPSVYIRDQQAWEEYQNLEVKGKLPKELYGDRNRVIGDDEQPVGCSQKRFTAGFLHHLNSNMERGFKELGVEVKLSNGRGQVIDVQKASKPLREAAAIAISLEEESKRRTNDMQAEFEQKYTEYDQQLKAQKAEIASNKEEIKSLKAEIKAAKTELNGLKRAIKKARGILRDIGERIGGLIQTGLNRIKKAKSCKEKDDAAKEAEGQLLRIKTDAEAVLNAFMPFDDEEEKKEVPEEEYDEREW